MNKLENKEISFSLSDRGDNQNTLNEYVKKPKTRTSHKNYVKEIRLMLKDEALKK